MPDITVDDGSPEEKKIGELSPNLITSSDLVNQIGSLSVEILNKNKVLSGLWANVNALTKSNETLKTEYKVLLEKVTQLDNDMETHKRLVSESEKEKISLIQNHKSEKIKNIEEILRLKKTLKSIEGESIINQEELRKELMIARVAIKEQKKAPKSVNKKKVNSKPARA